MIACNLDRLGAVTNGLVVGGQIVVVVLFLLLVYSRRVALAERIARLAAHRLNIDVLALGAPTIDETLRCLDNVRVEGTRESFVTGYNDDKNVLLLAFDQKWMQDIACIVVVKIG